MYIRKENLQNRSRPLGNAIFRSVLIFVNKNYRDGVLTYLWARDVPAGSWDTWRFIRWLAVGVFVDREKTGIDP